MKKYHIGCSGYFYKEWKGKFYPEDLPTNKWLQFYCQNFNTLEINASFYKFPEIKNLTRWHNKTPHEFTFSIKAPQMITHYTKFTDILLINKFYEVVQRGLKEKLKCVLYQMPPSLKYSPTLLDLIIKVLNPEYTNVIEFRHASWWNENVYEALRSRNITFCSISFPNLPEDFKVTSPIGYIRLHGIKELYKSNYTPEEIDIWTKKIRAEKFEDLYLYFNNTWNVFAVKNASEIKKILKNEGL